MKKLGLVFVLVLAAMISNAQLFVGGSFDLELGSNVTENNSTTTSDRSSYLFGFNPKVGFFLSDKFSIGTSLNLRTSGSINSTNPNNEIRNTTFTWSLTPFARLSFVEFGKFSVLAEGRVGIGGTTSKIKIGADSTDDPSTFNYGINITPILSYSLSNRINLEAALNFMNMGLNGTLKDDKDKNETTSTIDFDLGVNSRNAFNVGAMTVGLIIKL